MPVMRARFAMADFSSIRAALVAVYTRLDDERTGPRAPPQWAGAAACPPERRGATRRAAPGHGRTGAFPAQRNHALGLGGGRSPDRRLGRSSRTRARDR